ncbi:MAG: hypothetical protein KC636_35995, partial [Myxococcales bacterium]|nr:hypothetical protein [Myxococcales bacterium]
PPPEHAALVAGRLRPLPVFVSVASTLAEFEHLAGAPCSGGERFVEWRDALASLDEDTRRAALGRLGEGWGVALTTLDELRCELRLRALVAHHAAMRAAELVCFQPPLEPAALARWEQARGLSLPPYARRVFTELGTYEDIDADILALDPRSDELRCGPRLDELFAEIDPDALAGPERLRGRIARALERLASGDLGPLPRDVEVAPGRLPLPVAWIGGWFEGNHGDDNLLLVCCGALADQLLGARNMFHGGDQLRPIGHLIDWLYERYFDALEAPVPADERVIVDDSLLPGLRFTDS